MDVSSDSAQQTLAQDNSIALCLSGGGLRATLFHLGLIRALRAYHLHGQMALKSVKEVFAVSGGSILAAHMLQNFERYTGSDKDFESVTKEILALAEFDIRNRVIRRWGLTFLFKSRAYWLQNQYERFFGKATLGECYKDKNRHLPTFHFLTTNFNTGELCSFSRKDFETTRRMGGNSSTDSTSADSVPLAFAVAASSSFPPMFPPVRLTPQRLGFPANPEFASPIDLSDGGVYDNFGIEKFRIAARGEAAPDVLIVSHAGGSFDAAPGKRYRWMMARNIRASDIMMRRVGDASLEAAQAVAGSGYALVRIGATVDDGTLDETTQQLLRLVRTDLDRFAPNIAQRLIDHGYRIACNVFDQRGWSSLDRPEIAPTSNQGDRAAKAVRNASTRRLAPLVLDIRDFGWLSLTWLVAACVATGVGICVKKYRDAQLDEKAALYEGYRAVIKNEAEQNAANAQDRQLGVIRSAAATGNMADVRRALAMPTLAPDENALSGALPPPPSNLDDLKRMTDTTAPTYSLGVTSQPQRVSIQFAGMLTRGQISSLNKGLRAAGWQTQGSSGERTPKAANRNEVRYSGANQNAAVELASRINQSGLLSKKVTVKELATIGTDNLEVWISR
jgi:predicted acylesterase/phospholipase RssA